MDSADSLRSDDSDGGAGGGGLETVFGSFGELLLASSPADHHIGTLLCCHVALCARHRGRGWRVGRNTELFFADGARFAAARSFSTAQNPQLLKLVRSVLNNKPFLIAGLGFGGRVAAAAAAATGGKGGGGGGPGVWAGRSASNNGLLGLRGQAALKPSMALSQDGPVLGQVLLAFWVASSTSVAIPTTSR